MNLFIDNEFNGMGGALISMALVSEDGAREFYEVVPLKEPVVGWVKENVMPILHKDPISYDEFQNRLKRFLQQFPSVNIIADYPDDIKYFMESVITGPGEWFETQPLTTEVQDNLSAKKSKILHNALEDARALRHDWMEKTFA